MHRVDRRLIACGIAGLLAMGLMSASRVTVPATIAAEPIPDTGQPPEVIAAWGDSLTHGFGATVPYPTALGRLRHVLVYNLGADGESSTQVRARLMADPAKHGVYAVFWAGHNRFDPPTLKHDLAAMVARLTTSKYLVLGVVNGADEPRDSSVYSEKLVLNWQLARVYEGHFLDVRTVLVNAYDLSIPQDVIDHAHDIPPASLRSDAVHLNDAGYAVVARAVDTYIAAHP